MRILIYHGKHGDKYFDISTDSLRRGAYRHLLDDLGSVGYYDGNAEADEEELFDKAAAGDEEAVMRFMQLRSRRGYEYEGIEEMDVPQFEAKS